ncbi:MAG: barstar family protein [Gemmatimonadaceae bacterium]
MAETPTYRIDGAAFDDLGGFFDEIGEQLLAGAAWGRDLESLDDVLSGEVAPLPRELRLVWEHSDLSRRRLGTSFAELLEVIAAHPNVELVLS